MFERRVTVFVGHFGSGKTEIAVNSAVQLARRGEGVALVDLDIVKPYFRSRSARDEIAAAGVTLVAPTGDHFHADLPIIVPQVRALVRQSRVKVLLDVGGDDSGARVLGSLKDCVSPDEVETLLVVNFRRPFTETVEAGQAMLADIEASSRMRITGLISNTHLMQDTDLALVCEGHAMARELGARVGLPVCAVVAMGEVARGLGALDCPVIALERLIKPPFEQPSARTTGPLFAME